MKLLVVGSGGREHAIAKKLLESEQVEQVFVAPGNDGMTLDGIELVNIGISEHSAIINFAKENDVAWTFVGPDDALAAGIVDDFEQAGLKAFGPSRLAAELEWSKDFAKQIMVKYGIPTAAFGTFSNFEEAKAYIEEQVHQSWSRRTAWHWARAWSWRKPSSRRSKRHGRCSWTTSSATQVPAWSSRSSWRVRSFPLCSGQWRPILHSADSPGPQACL